MDLRPTALALLACALVVAAIAGGCGGDDDGDGSTATAPATTASPSPSAGGGDKAAGAGTAESGKGSADEGGSRDGGADGGGSGAVSPEQHEAELENFGPGSGDDSIQTYGTVAEGEEEEEVVEAMLAYFRAIADGDYDTVCASVSEPNREQLQKFQEASKKGEDCASFVATLLRSQRAVAKKAMKGDVAGVRVGDGNAFVLFTPAGGPESYFVMKHEGSEWKATSLGAGTPFDPTAVPTG